MPFIKKSLMNKKKIIRVTTVADSICFYSDLIPALQKDYEVVGVSSPGKELDELSEKGIRTIEVAMERRISIVSDIKSLWKMYKVLRKESPYIVHSITPKAGLITMIASWLCRVPVRIHTFTGLVWPTAKGIQRRILMATDWLTCACATHIIPEGEGVKADLLNHHITSKPIKVLGYGNVRGVDMEYFKPEPRNTEDVFTFVFIGRIVKDKGINELVAAFKRVNEKHKHVRLVLVGPKEDNLDPILPETAAEIHSNNAITEVGSQKDVRPFYQNADALVFPSYREGFPNVVLEAGAMGLPSIVTDINGSREIIVESKNGTIIPPHDEQALYEAMLNWVENPQEVASMAANARKMISERFEKSFVQKCMIDFYNKVSNTY